MDPAPVCHARNAVLASSSMRGATPPAMSGFEILFHRRIPENGQRKTAFPASRKGGFV